MNSTALSGLARRLVKERLLSEEDAIKHLTESKQKQLSLINYLVTENILPAARIAIIASHEFGTPVYDLACHNMASIPKDLVDNRLINKHQALPLYKRGNRLFLAVTDPTNLNALDEIKFHTGINTDAILVEADKLNTAIDKYLNDEGEILSGSLDGMDGDGLENLDSSAGKTGGDGDDDAADSDEVPVVRFINKVLVDAIKLGASDIHFEPYEKSYRIRFRIDGLLEEVSRQPVKLAARLAARLKVMAQLDISERRLPQDGRIKLRISARKAIDFRVNTLPTLFGEKIVMRILDSSAAKLGIDALGYEEHQKSFYLNALSQPQGMILVTGPTGSGKTVSLYTGIGILNTKERNISTAEDPVEINMEGINQVQINNRVGLNFAEALRSFLRQDPDVVMVGEIRDLETAEIAIKAAQTGHLVLSTLHTNSAAETLTRLLNMGVPTFNVATTVSLIIAQRLSRKLCPHCRIKMKDIPEDILQEEGLTEAAIKINRKDWQLYLHNPAGCAKCSGGYKGRVGVYEVVPITPRLSRLIMENSNSLAIAAAAEKEGFHNLRISALRKVAQGIISLEEANRITKD